MLTGDRKNALVECVRKYFEACNEGNCEKMYSCFADDVVHYFPAGVGGPYIGKKSIANLWINSARTNGSRWTIDRIVANASTVAIEWSHFKPKVGELIRGAEWYEFNAHGLITVIRAYYASPRDAHRKVNELEGFSYASRGFPVTPPE